MKCAVNAYQAAGQAERVTLEDLIKYATNHQPSAGIAFTDGTLKPVDGGGWVFESDTVTPPDWRGCHFYTGAAYRAKSTEAEAKECVDDVGSDKYWDNELQEYLDTMWWRCKGHLIFFLISLELSLRKDPQMPELFRWAVFPDPTDYGKSSFVDFIADKLGLQEGVKTFRAIWLADEEKLRAEALPYINEPITKVPELNGPVKSSTWKSLPKKGEKQLLRLCHAADSVQVSLANQLRVVEMNPEHNGMHFADEEDSFGAIVKMTVCLSKEMAGGSRFTRKNDEVAPSRGVFKLDPGKIVHMQKDGARRAFWRYFMRMFSGEKYNMANNLNYMKDLKHFDEDHGTKLQQHTEAWVEKMGIRKNIERNPTGTTANGTNPTAEPEQARDQYGGQWDFRGVQTSRIMRSQKEKALWANRLRRGEAIERKTWHNVNKRSTGSVYIRRFVPAEDRLLFGQRGKRVYREKPNTSGLKFHLKFGKDRGPEKLQEYLTGALAAGPLGLLVSYQFYRALLNRDEGSRRTALKAAAATITRESRGAGHLHKKKIADIRNCDFVMLLVSVELLNLPHPPPLRHLRQIVERREEVFELLGDGMTYEEKKDLAIKSAYGLYALHPALGGLVEDLELVAELLAQAYPDYYAFIEARAESVERDDPDRKDPKRTMLSYIAHDRCNAVITTAEHVCSEIGVGVEAIINDAFMYAVEDHTLVEAVALPTIAERLRRDLGIMRPVPFALQDLVVSVGCGQIDTPDHQHKKTNAHEPLATATA